VALEWTAQNLTKESLGYLASLPMMARTEEFTYVHSTPFRPQDWNYIFLGSEALLNFKALTTPVGFIGHSHAPVVLCKEGSGQVHMTLERDVSVDLARQYLINVGSVGQPRDGNPEAAYGIYDSTVHTFSLLRVPYDIAMTQRKMIQAGLPHALAIRLAFGQ